MDDVSVGSRPQGSNIRRTLPRTTQRSTLQRSILRLTLAAAKRASAVRANRPARTYTIAHAGRQVRFGPVAFWIAVGTVVIMAGWSVTAATYLAFRDDVLRTLIARQAQQQFGYEDRIAELRAQIDRTTSRQLLDQEQFEQKLDDLMRRQATLESRATALGNLADPTTTGSIEARPYRPGTDSAAAPMRNDRGRQSSIGATLDRMEASLDRVDRRQSLALGALERPLRRQGRPHPRRPQSARGEARRARRMPAVPSSPSSCRPPTKDLSARCSA